jgi:hypothetical protein
MLRMIRLKPHRGELMCWSEKVRGVDAGDGCVGRDVASGVDIVCSRMCV